MQYVRIGFIAITAALLSLGIAGCNPDVPGLTSHRTVHRSLPRTYHMYVPSSYDGSEPLPLVVAFHRFTETGKHMAYISQFNETAEREGFLVAYPDGLMRTFDVLDVTRDEVGFVRTIVDDVAARYDVDFSRIYATGASNGAFLTYKLAFEAGDLFAAFAPVMATMLVDIPKGGPPDTPRPMLIIHGTEDPIIPYDQELVFAGPNRTISLFPAPETVAFWVEANDCNPTPEIEELPENDRTDGTTVVRETYLGNDTRSEVIHYRVEGGGHTWPGGREVWPRPFVGRLSKEFNAADVIWNFLERHSLEPAAIR